eukprot:TRINITY_DN101706_c0_g1_i1.p2 TRINITY_DN101706_c0_g1~~TRINITY_DN101706_c0_g1_i1.p2  ORF type:complete len:238 (+),score=66.14 TRINITY_DN101706_c0_g1_i1:94-807(+)
MSATRDELFFMARIAEKCKRFEDQTEYMTRVVQLEPHQLNEEERSCLATAFKNALAKPRHAYKVVRASLMEGAEPEVSDELQNYLANVEGKVRYYCQSAHENLQALIPAAATAEDQVFYHKMMGDYCRYLSEVSRPDEMPEVKERALGAYTAGAQAAQSLPVTNSVAMSLALNMAVFYHELMKNQSEAIRVTREALSQISPEAPVEEDVKEICNLLRDNLELWTAGTMNDGTAVEEF